MKKILTVAASLLVIVLACTKNVHTPTPEPPIDIREVLTKQAWQVKELRALQQNTMYYYLRGSANNQPNFNQDKEYIIFKDDNTGIYNDGGTTYNITSWGFKDSSKSVLGFSIDYGNLTLPVTWEHLKVTKDSLTYDEYYTRQNTLSLAVGTRIPLVVPTQK